MPEIVIENLNSKSIHCESKSERLLHILASKVEWMQSCGGNGRCTTCAAQIILGHENLGKKSEAEIRFIKLGKLGSNERLACQCNVFGDLCVNVPERNKFPHISYSK